MRIRRIFLLLFIVFAVSYSAHAQGNSTPAVVLTADGPIMPPMLEYFQRGIETAEQRDAVAGQDHDQRRNQHGRQHQARPGRFVKGTRQLRKQQRRQAAEPTQYQPIDELIHDEEASLPAACIESDPVPAIDLALDIEVVLSRLPPAVQETARELRTGNISEVARRLGLSRRTIRDRVGQLREAFVRAGYGDA